MIITIVIIIIIIIFVVVGGNLKTQGKLKMKTRSQNTCCIGRRADKSGPRPSQRNQAEVEQCVIETNSSLELPSEPQNRENTNLGPLDPSFPKAMRIIWTHVEYKEPVAAFYKALREPKDNTKRQTYELWRQKVGAHKSYIDINELANVRRDIMEKNGLTAADIKEIKTKIREAIKTER